jgi:uncharacterized protein YecT (DUF1311 family)
MRHGCHRWPRATRRTSVLILALAGWLPALPAHAAQQEALQSCRSMAEPELRHAGKAAVGLEIDDKKVLLETVKGAIGDQAVTGVLSAPGEIKRSGEPDAEIRLICLVGPGDTALFAHLVPTGPVSSLDVCYSRSSVRLDVGPCLEETLAAAERDMDGKLQDARKDAADLDKVTGRTHAAAALEASQRAWVAYRDEECHRRAALVAGGTGEGDIGLACRVDLTNARADELRP